MTTVNEWINSDARRRAPEFDFGTEWTREHDPHTDWAVTYNTGTGELYARTRNGDDVEVLGQFADPQDVADALPDWGRRSTQSGSLDWVRREALSLQRSQPKVNDNDPVYAVVLSVDGDATAVRTPQTTGDIAVRLGAGDLSRSTTSALDYSDVNTGDRTDRVVMWVDDRSNGNDLVVNSAATQLYGTGWPILGDAVVVTDDKRPLPLALVADLVTNLDQPEATYGLRITPGGDVIAIDNWSDTKVAGRDLGGRLRPWTVNANGRQQRVQIWTDHDAHDNGLPRNNTAMALFNGGWPVYGDAVVASLDGRSLLPETIADLKADMAPHRDVTALDWADHHHDRDPSPNIADNDMDLQPAQLEYVDIDDDAGDDPIAKMEPPTEQEVAALDSENRRNAVHQVIDFREDPEYHSDKSPEELSDMAQVVTDTRAMLADLDPPEQRIDLDLAEQLPQVMRVYIGTDKNIDVADDDMDLDL